MTLSDGKVRVRKSDVSSFPIDQEDSSIDEKSDIPMGSATRPLQQNNSSSGIVECK